MTVSINLLFDNIANPVGGHKEKPKHGRQAALQAANSIAYTSQTSYEHTSGRHVHNASTGPIVCTVAISTMAPDMKTTGRPLNGKDVKEKSCGMVSSDVIVWRSRNSVSSRLPDSTDSTTCIDILRPVWSSTQHPLVDAGLFLYTLTCDVLIAILVFLYYYDEDISRSMNRYTH